MVTQEDALAAELAPLEGPNGSIPLEPFCKALGMDPASSLARGLHASCSEQAPDGGGPRVTAARAARAASQLRSGDLETSLRLSVSAYLSGQARDTDSELAAADLAAVLQGLLADMRVEVPLGTLDQLAADIVAQADADGNGTLSFDEFFSFAMRFPRFRELAGGHLQRQVALARSSAAPRRVAQSLAARAALALRPYTFWVIFCCCVAAVDFWILNESLIYSTHSAAMWLQHFFGAIAGLAATFLLVPLTPLVVEPMRRSRLLTRLFDFDATVSIHKTLGYLLVLGGVAHSVCWCIAYGRTVGSTDPDLVSLVAPGLGHLEPTAAELYGSTAAITGWIMLATFMLTLPFATPYPKAWIKGSALGRLLHSFRGFHVSHQTLFLVFYACILVHPLPGIWTQPNRSVLWMFVALPLLLYFASRAYSIVQALSSLAPVVKAEVLDNAGGSVVVLHLRRPRERTRQSLLGRILRRDPRERQRFTFRPGQYVKVLCPNISTSASEWHPFTVSSSPSDELLTLHIAAVGDWTSSLLALVRDGHDDAGHTTGPCVPWWAVKAHRQAALAGGGGGGAAAAAAGEQDGLEKGDSVGSASAPLALRPEYPTIFLRGPFGAPAMAFERYRVLLLCSTGVGVTPMVSILKYLATLPADRRPHTFFRWVVREQTAPQRWVPSALLAAQEGDGQHHFDICMHYTGDGLGPQPSKVQSALLELVAEVHQARAGADLISGVASPHGAVRTEYGRPNWRAVMQQAARENPGAREIGVLFCGAKPVEADLRRCCSEASRLGRVHFVLHAENF